ncbi:MAG: hypothetical protein FWD31_04390 [Planctomycetaceae bacterium]|nr:hypothetical protein [Planctomycetaceae bacterium]
MPWLVVVAALAAGGFFFAYKTGVDDVIFRTISNWASSFFMYLLVKIIDLFVWLLDMLPDLPYAGHFASGISQFIIIAARANTFFPVAETFFMFSFVVGFLLVFIIIKLILKLIPTIG